MATHICILYILKHSSTYYVYTLNKLMIKSSDRVYILLDILSVPFLDYQRCIGHFDIDEDIVLRKQRSDSFCMSISITDF